MYFKEKLPGKLVHPLKTFKANFCSLSQLIIFVNVPFFYHAFTLITYIQLWPSYNRHNCMNCMLLLTNPSNDSYLNIDYDYAVFT